MTGMTTADNAPTTVPQRREGPAYRKARDAAQLRTLGYGWQEIADQVGYANRSNAYRSVRHYQTTMPEMTREDLRTEWRDRLIWLWTHAAKDVAEQRNGAVGQARGVVQTAMALDGLQAPEQIIVHSPTAMELERWVTSILAQQQPQVVEYDILGIGNGPTEQGETAEDEGDLGT